MISILPDHVRSTKCHVTRPAKSSPRYLGTFENCSNQINKNCFLKTYLCAINFALDYAFSFDYPNEMGGNVGILNGMISFRKHSHRTEQIFTNK